MRHPLPRCATALHVVGRGGLEPPTLRLSGVRSNHLSYRPARPDAEAARMSGGKPVDAARHLPLWPLDEGI